MGCRRNRQIFILKSVDNQQLLKQRLKVKSSFGNASLSKNEVEALITNHVKEYVLNNT